LRQFVISDLSMLQMVSLSKFTKLQRKVFFVNIYNLMFLLGHAKYGPPRGLEQRKRLYESASFVIDDLLWSIADIETKIILGISSYPENDKRAAYVIGGKNPELLFCLSDGTKSCPPTYVYREANFDELLLFSAKTFLQKTVISEQYNELLFPKIVQRLIMEFGLTPRELTETLRPFLPESTVEWMNEVLFFGGKMLFQFHLYDWSPFYIFKIEEDEPKELKKQKD